MKYHLSHLVKAPLGTKVTIQVNQDAQFLDKDLEIKVLQGQIHFTRVNSGIYAQGNLQTEVSLTCVRCLKPFSFLLDFKVAERYLFDPQDADDESGALFAPDGVIDITEPVRQQIWVSLPIQPLCNADCKGLCDQCGVNLNHHSCSCEKESLDPRLALLEELLEI